MKAKEVVNRYRQIIEKFIDEMMDDDLMENFGHNPEEVLSILVEHMKVYLAMELAFRKILKKNKKIIDRNYDLLLIMLIYSRIRLHKRKLYSSKFNMKENSAIILATMREECEKEGLLWHELTRKEKYKEVLRFVFLLDMEDSFSMFHGLDILQMYKYIGSTILLDIYMKESSFVLD